MGVSLVDLWLPIIIGSALAWVASALIHMLLKYHNSDYLQLGNESEVAASIRNGAPRPGVHSIPYCVDMSQMGDPGMQAKFNEGPVALLTVFPSGMPNMGKLVGQQFLHFLFGSVLIAWCATLALPAGAAYLAVFGFVAPVAFLAFGWACIPFSIWYGHRWASTAKYLLDALVYGLLIAGSLAWLWPGAA